MNTYSFKADDTKIAKIISDFSQEKILPGHDHLKCQIRDDGVVISFYNSGSVVISGQKAEDYYFRYFPHKEHVLPQAGSDEVGTGDFFGPICVCAAYVDEEVFRRIKSLNLTDSKQLTDLYIREIAPRLIEEVPHSLLILDNAKYNQLIGTYNMNAIKAKMHNQAYVNLMNKGITLPSLCVVDDFCGETLYYRYLKGTEEIFRGLTFHTKAESQYVSVAIGAIISRYAFLKHMDALGERYQTGFPKGAGKPVEDFLPDFVSIYGIEELRKVAKCNFKNYERLLEKAV